MHGNAAQFQQGIHKAPPRHALVLGDRTMGALTHRLDSAVRRIWDRALGRPSPPDPRDLQAPLRIAIDYASPADLGEKSTAAIDAAGRANAAVWRVLRSRGVFFGRNARPPVAFVLPGQGAQYPNMMRGLAGREPVVAEVFEVADRVMEPLLGAPLTSFFWADEDDAAAMDRARAALVRPEVSNPAVIAADVAVARLLAAYGVEPDLLLGHSLGEYAALVLAGSLTLEAAIEISSFIQQECSGLRFRPGGMAAVLAPAAETERIVSTLDGVVVANHNSGGQQVIGGDERAVADAIGAFGSEGHTAVPLAIGRAFHTSLVDPLVDPIRRSALRWGMRPPSLPVVHCSDGRLFPPGITEDAMARRLGRHVATPVEFVRSLETAYDAGARVFVEVGPRRILNGFVDNVLGTQDDVVTVYTNHARTGEAESLNRALCALWAAGIGHRPPTVAAGPRVSDETSVAVGRLLAGVFERPASPRWAS